MGECVVCSAYPYSRHGRCLCTPVESCRSCLGTDQHSRAAAASGSSTPPDVWLLWMYSETQHVVNRHEKLVKKHHSYIPQTLTSVTCASFRYNSKWLSENMTGFIKEGTIPKSSLRVEVFGFCHSNLNAPWKD